MILRFACTSQKKKKTTRIRFSNPKRFRMFYEPYNNTYDRHTKLDCVAVHSSNNMDLFLNLF